MKANKEPMDSSASKGTLTRERVEEMRREARARFEARAGKPFSRRTLALEKRLRAKLDKAYPEPAGDCRCDARFCVS